MPYWPDPSSDADPFTELVAPSSDPPTVQGASPRNVAPSHHPQAAPLAPLVDRTAVSQDPFSDGPAGHPAGPGAPLVGPPSADTPGPAGSIEDEGIAPAVESYVLIRTHRQVALRYLHRVWFVVLALFLAVGGIGFLIQHHGHADATRVITPRPVKRPTTTPRTTTPRTTPTTHPPTTTTEPVTTPTTQPRTTPTTQPVTTPTTEPVTTPTTQPVTTPTTEPVTTPTTQPQRSTSATATETVTCPSPVTLSVTGNGQLTVSGAGGTHTATGNPAQLTVSGPAGVYDLSDTGPAPTISWNASGASCS